MISCVMNWFRKNIANIVSVTRIVFLPFIIYFGLNGYNQYFVTLFILAFVGDAIDGTIARKLKIESEFGRLMDTIADYLFYPGSVLTILYIYRNDLVQDYIYFILPIIFFFVPKLIGFYFLKTYPHLHLRSWQVVSYPLSLWIIFSILYGFNIPLLIVINGLAILGFTEESLIYLIKREKTDQNINSIFQIL